MVFGLRALMVGAVGMAAPLLFAQRLVVAYVPNWGDIPAVTKAIDFGKITHINVAFENPIDDDGTMSYTKDNDLIVRAAKDHNVKVLISIGGGSAAGDKELIARYFALTTDAKRAGFVAKLTDFVVAHDFDGLDVDLEGPAIGMDYGKFIVDLKKSLQPKGKLVTAALSQGYGGDKVPDSTLKEFDFVNIMAYDGTGPWDANRAGQHSSFEMAKANVTYWLNRGLPKSKAVLGVPFYGYGFGNAFRQSDYSYASLVKTYPGAELVDQIGDTIWYNGMPTIKAKAKYVLDEGLAGVMIWSIDADFPGEKSLLSAIDGVLNSKPK